MDTTTDAQDSGYESPRQEHWSPRSTPSTPSAITGLGRSARKLVDTINKLVVHGVEANDLPLPKLVVVGDQSSGKSSLIEAISEIKVPRKSGTCTRCVLKINLKKAEAPSWGLSLIQQYFYQGNSTGRTAGDFFHWKKLQVPDEVSRISLQYDQIEEYLDRAQTALLCPTQDPDAVLRGTVEPQTVPKFSPNIVELNVTGPSLPDMTMYDLPGIINQGPDGDTELPKLVQGLARKYVENANTIVVLAVPMNHDMEVSTAARLVGQWKAKNRTIGVLTKPDTLPSGDDPHEWKQILCGQRFPLGKGYFVTKQPDSMELKQRISHAQARDNEMAFFQQSPWSDLFSDHQNRFGTGSLQAKLSSLLAEEIATCVPSIRMRLQKSLDGISKELSQFPKPPINPYGTIISIAEKLKADIDHVLLGDSPQANSLIREWRGFTTRLLTELKSMQPLTIVNTEPEAQWQSASQVISLDESDDEHIVPTMTPTAGTKRAGSANSLQESPTKRAKIRAPSASPHNAIRFTLDRIRAKIAETTTSGVPSDTDPRAEDLLIADSLAHWGNPLRNYLSSVHSSIDRHLIEIITNRTNQWLSTEFPQAVDTAVRGCFDEIYERHEQACMQALLAEQYKPFTANVEMLQYFRQEQLKTLRMHRLFARQKAYVGFNEKAANKPQSVGQERDRKAKSVKDKDLGEDPHDPEIQVMARVRGYYHLTAGTFADSIGKKSQYEVFEELRERLKVALPRGLGIDVDDAQCVENCKMLLAENQGREKKRQGLATQQQKLENAMGALAGVEQS